MIHIQLYKMIDSIWIIKNISKKKIYKINGILLLLINKSIKINNKINRKIQTVKN